MTQCHLTLAESFGLDPETSFCDKLLSFQLCAQLLSVGLRVGFCGPEDLPWEPGQSSKILWEECLAIQHSHSPPHAKPGTETPWPQSCCICPDLVFKTTLSSLDTVLYPFAWISILYSSWDPHTSDVPLRMVSPCHPFPVHCPVTICHIGSSNLELLDLRASRKQENKG